ncbi:MAG: hypothetical protein VB050_04915 [Geobacteraceae bacterium]|nr:hypothetical protein [Geobacteraceae bacterium]
MERLTDKDLRIRAAISWAKSGPRRAGQCEYLKFLHGIRITRQQAIKAACYRCSEGWDLGKSCSVPDCPLQSYAPYARSAKNQGQKGHEA